MAPIRPAGVPPIAPRATPRAGVTAQPTPPTVAPSMTPAAPPARPAPATPTASRPGVGMPTPTRTPINPFLANDPNAKARRLARALISDLVTYFPQRREEGIRDGTLKDLFREEIKKSYEEYIDQVGREFADSTTHFQDALNEILAGGRKMF